MAKPCRYQLPGQDTWMSEQELMQKLNDGLLDKFMSDNNIAVRNFKFTPNQDLASKFRTPVETAPVAETKAEETPQAEKGQEIVQTQVPRKKGWQNSVVKKEESTTPSGDKVTTYKAYAINESGKETYMGTGILTTVGEIAPLVKGTDGEAIFYDQDGNLKEDPNTELYITKTIEGTNQDGSYQQRVTVLGKGDLEFNGRAESSFTTNKNVVVGESSYKSNLTTKQQQETTPQAEATPTTPKSETVTEVKETSKSLLDESTEIIDSLKNGESFTFPDGSTVTKNGDSFDYQSSEKGTGKKKFSSREGMIFFTNNKLSESRVGSNIQLKDYDTETVNGNELKVGDVYVRDIRGTRYVFKVLSKPTRDKRGNFYDAKVEILSIGNQPTEFRTKTPSSELGKILESERAVGKTTVDSFKSITKDSNTFGKVKKINNWNEVESKSKQEQQITPKSETVTEIKETPKVETKAQPTLSKKDQEEAKILENDLDYYTRQMEDAQEQIDIEKSNFKEEKERISQEKAKVRLSKMSKDKKADKLEELDAELSDIKDDHDDLIEQYKDDIQEAKSELKRINNRKAKLEQKAKALVAETKAEPTTKAEEKLSPRVEKLKNDFVESYNNIPAKNNRQRSRKYQYISSKQSSLDPEERQAAELATSEIYQQDKAAEEAKTETKAQPVAPQKTTVSKVTEKAGPKTTQGTKVKAITQRGSDLQYTVNSISEDGKTATVQAPDRLKNPNDVTQGRVNGKVEILPIKENINGEKIVKTENGTTVYLDRVIAPAETTLFETKKKEEAVEKKDGRGTKKSVTFHINTGRDITRFTPKVTMEKNNRTNTWEIIKADGTKMEASVELQNQAQIEYNKQNGIKEQAKEVQQEAIEANKDNTEAQEFAKSDIGMDAAEAFVEPTDTQPKQKRKRTKQQANRDYQATARRGASTNVTQAFIDKLKNAFPNVFVFNDQDAFDRISNQLGRPLGTAAILHNGVIYLNPSQANLNTALEEYAHVYLLMMKSINPNLYRMGIELVRKDGKQYLDEVKNDPGYADISNDPEAQAFEALSKMIADRGETIEDARQKSKVKEFLKDLWRNIYQFISGKSKIKEDVDTLESYVDKVSRELLKNSPISNLSTSDLSKLQNKENIGNISVKSSIIERTTNRATQFNRIFRPNRGVSQSIADRVNKAQNMVKIFENRSNAVLKEFNSGMKDYYKQKGINTDAEKLIVLRDVDRALKDSEFRNNWFSSDSEAETLIKPSVDKMRSLVDKLSTDLKNSGMLSDDLELTIDGNLDMYLNTSYMFYSPSYTGEWMDVFTPDEKDQILDYFRGQRVQPAKTIVYKVNNDGSVEATFENSFGDKIERRYDTMDSFKMALAETARYNPATGNPANKKLDVVALNLSDSKGKRHELDFNQGLDISSIDRFSTSDNAIIEYINQQRKEIIEKKTSAKSFMFGSQNITDSQANKILKKKKNMREVQRLLLKEVQDPSTNFLNTIRKQSELLFKRGLEQEIVNSGYLARPTRQGNLTKKLNKPGSLLNGMYVTPEMHDLLTNKRLTDVNSSYFKIISIPSMIMKSLVTIVSPTSNAGNFGSGFVQTLMTGNNPFSSDMATAMRALQEQAKISRASKGGITTEDAYGMIFNTVPTVLRGIVNVANIKPKGFKEGISKLSDDQKQQYGVNSFDQLSDQDKARVILEELIENGAISPGINSGIVMDLLVASFQNKEMVQAQKTKMDMIGKALKKKFSESIDLAASVYQFSDSMFKAIVYMQEKAKRYETYGSVMKKKGMSDQEIEAEIRRMTAEVVKKQMPSYDRSPEFIKTISRVPFFGPFVQFDYQSKVNGFNILADGVKLMSDGGNMIKEGYTSEGTKLLFNGAAKVAASTATWFMSYGIVKLASYAAGGFVDGEDDETVRLLLPEYRGRSPIIHLDKEANGQHAYIDIGRVDPQSLYLKYYRAFSEEGFEAGIGEILKPYITQDIFYGGLGETLFGKNKYGNADKAIENLSFGGKLMYTLNERLLPSTVFGAADRVYKSLTGVKENDVSLDPFWEFTNVFFGVKKRDINMSKEAGKMIHYRILKDITDVDKVNFDVKLKEFEKKEESGAKITENDRENLQEAYEELVTNSNQRVQDARDMVLRLKNLGTKEDVIKKSLEDANTPKYLIRKVMADEFIPIKYDEEGDRIQYKKPKSTGRPSRPKRPKRPKRPSR